MSDAIDDPFDIKYRSPQLDDKLFADTIDYWMSASIGWYYDPTEIYIMGYKEAGDCLVNSVAEQKGTPDSLLFPIVFLYRHYIEIRLKSLLQDGSQLLDLEYNPKAEHRLSKLWSEVRKIITTLWPSGDKNELRSIDLLIHQFEQVDPHSTAFRYPKDLEGNNSLKIETPRVNLRNLKEVWECQPKFDHL